MQSVTFYFRVSHIFTLQNTLFLNLEWAFQNKTTLNNKYT